jgi:hypothetical protein
MATAAMRRAILCGLDQTGPITDRIDAVLTALDRAGFTIITTADALAAARCANNAVVLGVSDADPDLARRLEPNT